LAGLVFISILFTSLGQHSFPEWRVRTILVDKPKAAFSQLKPKLALGFGPRGAGLRQTFQNTGNDGINLRGAVS
jgi:hypothetical protein